MTVAAPGSAAVATPTGLVIFYDNGTSVGLGTLHAASGMAMASFSTSSLTVGRYQITAIYTSGDGNFNASPASAALTQTVQPASIIGGGGGPPPIRVPLRPLRHKPGPSGPRRFSRRRQRPSRPTRTRPRHRPNRPSSPRSPRLCPLSKADEHHFGTSGNRPDQRTDLGDRFPLRRPRQPAGRELSSKQPEG